MKLNKIPVWTKEQQAEYAKTVRQKDFPVSKHVAEVFCDGDASGFDRARSIGVDSTSGVDVKSKS